MRSPRKRLGEYNKRVAIWSTTLTTDSMGGSTESTPASATATVWARVEPMQGSRQLQYAQITGMQGYAFTFPYRSDVTIDYTNYLVFGTRKFQITSILDTDEANKELIILAYEKK